MSDDSGQLYLLHGLTTTDGQTVLKIVMGQPEKKYKLKKDWGKNLLKYETWTLDAQYCSDSNRDCNGCPINLSYGLKDQCKMPESVKLLKDLENDGVKLHLQRDGALIIRRRIKSIYKHI